ncbi:alpha/beta hydrolase-fold protein [Dactylosporangium sp. NPDC000521]|uniref:alpha/beta hydrolase-fold protein n=1 Tax=Dactylosporangium sp. NPDC000521 TaxID=3363975 RepID=UPI00367CBD0A
MWRTRKTTLTATAIVVLLAAVFAAYAGLFDDVPLLNPTVAHAVELLAVAGLIGSWIRRDRRWLLRTLPLLLASATALTAATVVLLRLTETVRDRYPPMFDLWFAALVAAALGVPLALPRPGVIRRITAVAAVPLTLAGGLLFANQIYAVWPNVGGLLDHTGAVSSGNLERTLRGTSPDARAEGVLGAFDMPAAASHFAHRPGYVYLPPAYFTAPRPDLPVLLVLAGVPGWTSQWLEAGHAVTTDATYAAEHHGVAPVLVFADQNGATYRDTECVDGQQGNAETFLTVDIPAFVTATLHLKHDPKTWGVVGFFEGGTCAADLVIAHPDVYRHLVDLGGEPRPTLRNAQTTLQLYNGSVTDEEAHDPARLLATHHYDGVTAWFAAGADDSRGIATARELARSAATAGITSHEFTGTGGHNWRFASTAFARVLPPLGSDLGIR